MKKEQYHCLTCKKELSDNEISYVRLMQLIDHSYDLKTENDKMKKFIINLSKRCHPEDAIDEAQDLLKEIGEA